LGRGPGRDRARRENQLPSTVDVRALARFYCAVFQSLSVLHKALGDRETLENVVDVAVQAWPAARRNVEKIE
jgi:hypothetical protein